MGNYFRKERQIVMFGLDGAGKTQLLYKFTTGETIRTNPTSTFEVETKQFDNQKLRVVNVGGHGHKVKYIWKHCICNVDAIIFVIDMSDVARMKCDDNKCDRCIYEAILLLMRSELMTNIPILIFANKQDLPNTYSSEKLEMLFDCSKLFEEHKWKIQPCSAINGNGIDEGFRWLIENMNQK